MYVCNPCTLPRLDLPVSAVTFPWVSHTTGVMLHWPQASSNLKAIQSQAKPRRTRHVCCTSQAILCILCRVRALLADVFAAASEDPNDTTVAVHACVQAARGRKPTYINTRTNMNRCMPRDANGGRAGFGLIRSSLPPHLVLISSTACHPWTCV